MHSNISMQQFLSQKAKVKVHSTAFTRSKSQVHTNNLGRSPEIAANSTCKSRGLTVFMEKSLPELVDPMSLQFILLKTEITSDILRPRNHIKMQNNIEAVYLVCHLCITCFCFRARRTLPDFRPRPQSLFFHAVKETKMAGNLRCFIWYPSDMFSHYENVSKMHF